MTITHTAVQGFGDPMPLREFLRRYFSLHVVSSAAPADHGGDDAAADAPQLSRRRCLALPSTPYSTLVYVSLGAPPPPPPVVATLSNDLCGRPAVQVLSMVPSCQLLARSCLSHPSWALLCNALGAQGTGFILAHCAITVQFAPGCGMLQVLGRSLSMMCPSSTVGRKRFRSSSSAALPTWVPPPIAVAKRHRAEVQSATGSHNSQGHKKSLAALHNVSRLPLTRFDRHHWRQVCLGAACPQSVGEGGTAGPLHASTPAGLRLMELALRIAGDAKGPQVVANVAAALRAHLLEGHVLEEVFRGTLCEPGAAGQNSKGLRAFLAHLASLLLAQIALANVRGAAIYVGGDHDPLQQREGQTPQRQRPIHLRAHASVAVVLRYLRRVLGRLRWCALSDNVQQHLQHSFWSTAHTVHRNSIRPSSKRRRGKRAQGKALQRRAEHKTQRCSEGLTALDALLVTVGQWLRMGTRGTFPLHLFADRVSVHNVPWLAGGAMCNNSTGATSNKSRHSRTYRGMWQQRLWLEVCQLLMEGPAVYLITASFHVTWSPKAPSSLQFYHAHAFREWEHAELQRIRHSAPTTSLMPQPEVAEVSVRSARELPPPMDLRPLTSRRHVRRRGAVSPLRQMQQLYSHHRLLPDGKKLRAVATIRYGTLSALQGYAKRWHRRRNLKGALRRKGAVVIAGRVPSVATPNRTVLRDCLDVLLVGASERQRHLGHCLFSHRRHDEEYIAWREFIGSCRRLARTSAGMTPPTVFVVRGDASRCFDRLPQDRLVSAVHTLVSHTTYHRVHLDAIAPSPSQPTAGERAWMRRPWSVVLTAQDYTDGVVRGIPPGWVVTEPSLPAAESLTDWNGGKANSEVLDGAYLRQVLVQHVQQHYSVLSGRLYEQHNGITQGSSVATLLCDALLSDSVDQCLATVLEQFDATSTLLRRVDDVLIATTSACASAACDAAIECGWAAESGYMRNVDKSHVVCAPLPVTRNETEAADGGHSQDEATATTSWCGLVWHISTLEFSVDWGRLLSRDALHACRLRPIIRPRTECDIILACLRVVGVLQIRTPLTVFCATVNSKSRVLQTVAEMCCIFAESFASKLIDSLRFIRPHVRCLLRPLAVAASGLRRHLLKRGMELAQRGSACGVAEAELTFMLMRTVLHSFQERQRHHSAPGVDVSRADSAAAVGRRDAVVAQYWRRLLGMLKLKVAAARTLLGSSDEVPRRCEEAMLRAKVALKDIAR